MCEQLLFSKPNCKSSLTRIDSNRCSDTISNSLDNTGDNVMPLLKSEHGDLTQLEMYKGTIIHLQKSLGTNE